MVHLRRDEVERMLGDLDRGHDEDGGRGSDDVTVSFPVAKVLLSLGRELLGI